MDILTARPKLLKQANLSLIRKVIIAKGTVTRAEIVNETKISATTVRSLLAEMMENGEIGSVGYDESSGGRKAERYILKPDRYYGAAFCITDNQVHSLLINVRGEILETARLEAPDDDFEAAIVSFLDGLTGRKEIKAIGIGVPGIVDGGGFWRKNKGDDELAKVGIGDHLARRYRIPVVLENDLNATTIGFGRCYEKEFPCENPEDTNMAYLHFEDGCISAGFIAEGRVLRGCNNFAGELGLIPVDNSQLLDDYMFRPMNDVSYTNTVIRIVSWICGILNPQYVVLGGPSLREECVGPIGDGLSAMLPKRMATQILYAPDVWHDYYEGMAYLTAVRMFDDIQFIKE